MGIPLVNKRDTGIQTICHSQCFPDDHHVTPLCRETRFKPSVLPVIVESLPSQNGSPNPPISRSNCRSCSLRDDSVMARRQASLYSVRNLTLAQSLSILMQRDWILARVIAGREIRPWPCHFNLWVQSPQCLPPFLTHDNLGHRPGCLECLECYCGAQSSSCC